MKQLIKLVLIFVISASAETTVYLDNDVFDKYVGNSENEKYIKTSSRHLEYWQYPSSFITLNSKGFLDLKEKTDTNYVLPDEFIDYEVLVMVTKPAQNRVYNSIYKIRASSKQDVYFHFRAYYSEIRDRFKQYKNEKVNLVIAAIYEDKKRQKLYSLANNRNEQKKK